MFEYILLFRTILKVSSSRQEADDTNGNADAHDNPLPTGIDVFIIKLLDILKYQFERAQQNFVSAAALTPMHGKNKF